MINIVDKRMIRKFDKPGPRYTSYPTAPAWENAIDETIYRRKLKEFGAGAKSLSLYLHIPFCESMCTYCACSVVIRKNEAKVGDEYLERLLREIDMTAQAIGKRTSVKQLHWGGGTPTFLNAGQIERLYRHIGQRFDVDSRGEIAIEIDPRTVTQEKLRLLKQLGFNRISLGIQDFSSDVQQSVNRLQPFDLVKAVYDQCRGLEFSSINFDLIYGLPRQTTESFTDTVNQAAALRPDRIALYSFAYVPWLKKHQSKIDASSLPDAERKLEIFLSAREIFIQAGYQAIAMDHFALADDELAKAFREGSLYRNFMGYTVKPADEFIGLGVSSIGFLETTFFQNAKTLPDYYAAVDEGRLPIKRGKELTADDRIRQWTINSLMCRFSLDKEQFKKNFGVDFDDYFRRELPKLDACAADGLVKVGESCVNVTELGKVFIRNVCMCFDAYLEEKSGEQRYSRTV
jgi:oxygen-independent coproporphyrinogen-3 oxidase